MKWSAYSYSGFKVPGPLYRFLHSTDHAALGSIADKSPAISRRLSIRS